MVNMFSENDAHMSDYRCGPVLAAGGEEMGTEGWGRDWKRWTNGGGGNSKDNEASRGGAEYGNGLQRKPHTGIKPVGLYHHDSILSTPCQNEYFMNLLTVRLACQHALRSAFLTV